MADDRRAERWVIVLPPVPPSVPEARRFAREALLALGLPHTEEAVALPVSELTTNAVLHAGTPVRLSVFRYDGVLRVEVSDDDTSPPRLVDPDPMRSGGRAGGRGIMLVDALGQRWGVDADEWGKTIWFELAA